MSLISSSKIFADNFYKNLLLQAQQDYAKGDYHQAISNLKIAEFGIRDDKNLMKEVYFYYLSSYFKLRKIKEVQKLLKIIQDKYKIADFSNNDFPKIIRQDLSILNIFIRKDILNSKNIEQRILYETLFYKTITHIEEISGEKLKKIHSRLIQINKVDKRKQIISAFIDFRAEKYKKVVKKIRAVIHKTQFILPEIRDEIHFYLALSFFYLDRQEEALTALQNITNHAIIERFRSLLKEQENTR
jgi:lipopolysaccharide biosynthesis regulator YciM